MAAIVARKPLVIAMAVMFSAMMIGAATMLIHQTWWRPNTITAYFSTAPSIYPDDEVRVLGVKVGRISAIEPDGTQARFTLEINNDIKIPAGASAVVVAPNLVSARYVQLTPAYRSAGPALADGAVIPLQRTAVPVEWDQVKEQLTRLATELGPVGQTKTTSVSRFIDSAANALGGNGDKLRQTLSQLSAAGRIFSDGGRDFVSIIKDLQTFVTALRDSKEQIVQFEDHLASLTSTLDGSRSDLDGALKNLSDAVGDVQRFVSGSRDATAEQIQRLAEVTQNLADHRMDLEQVLHVSPNALVNAYNMVDPRTGGSAGEFLLRNLANPTHFFCTMIGGLGNVTSAETAKLCAQTLGPGLDRLNVNYIPFPINPFQIGVPPWQDLIYSEARLQPGGEGPKPPVPDQLPAVSAYTGAPGDTPNAVPPPSPPGPAPTATDASPAPAPTSDTPGPFPAERPSP